MLPDMLSQLQGSLNNQANAGGMLSPGALALREELSRVATALKLASAAGVLRPDHFAGIPSGNLSDVGPLLTGSCGQCGKPF